MSIMEGSASWRASERAHSNTLSEIAQEKAASLGRAGARLERALQALEESGTSEDKVLRDELTNEACEALFNYLVQREACGLRDMHELLRELRVPYEVQLAMGAKRRRV